MNTKVKSWLGKLPTKKRTLATKVMKTVLSSDANVVEEIKWGSISFSSGKKVFAFIMNYPNKDYINLAFTRGTKLSDINNLLEGTGKSMRHQKISKDSQINQKQIMAWTKQSLKLIK
jgi:hypothetical protein